MDATVAVPVSKSLAARRLVLAAQAPGGPAPFEGGGDDVAAMVRGLRTLREGHVDAGRAGTVLRFLMPLAAAGARPVTFTGDPQLVRRPLAPLARALRAVGAQVSADALPLTVTPGPVLTSTVEVDAAASSQLVSGLLLAAPAFAEPLTVRWSHAPSIGHVHMTLACLEAAGIQVSTHSPVGADGAVTVTPGVPRADRVEVEPDLAAAAPFLIAAALLGGRVTLRGWPAAPVQRSPELARLLEAWGARFEAGTLLAAPAGPRPGVQLDLRGHAELLPVIGAALASAATPSRLTGLRHARGHESDRVAALAANLAALGTGVEETEDSLLITPAPTRAAVWRTHEDHRLVMAGAVAALGTPGLVLDDGRAVTKTYPEFLNHWRTMFEQARA